MNSLPFRLLTLILLLFFSSVVAATDLQNEIENERTLNRIRQGFIVAQSELLQRHLDIKPISRTANNLDFKELETLKFTPPYNFLDRVGPHLDILKKEDGDELLKNAKQIIFSLGNENKKCSVFYFQILFWNALTEQIQNPDLVKHPWHKISRQSIFQTECESQK